MGRRRATPVADAEVVRGYRGAIRTEWLDERDPTAGGLDRTPHRPALRRRPAETRGRRARSAERIPGCPRSRPSSEAPELRRVWLASLASNARVVAAGGGRRWLILLQLHRQPRRRWVRLQLRAPAFLLSTSGRPALRFRSGPATRSSSARQLPHGCGAYSTTLAGPGVGQPQFIAPCAGASRALIDGNGRFAQLAGSRRRPRRDPPGVWAHVRRVAAGAATTSGSAATCATLARAGPAGSSTRRASAPRASTPRGGPRRPLARRSTSTGRTSRRPGRGACAGWTGHDRADRFQLREDGRHARSRSPTTAPSP